VQAVIFYHNHAYKQIIKNPPPWLDKSDINLNKHKVKVERGKTVAWE